MALGCVALAIRPPSFASIGTLAVIGLLGAAGPLPTMGRRSASGAVRWPLPTMGRRRATGTVPGWAASAIGVAAFGAVRFFGPAHPTPAGGWLLAALVLAAVAEEAFFRRYLYGWCAGRGDALAVVVAAAAFALVHVPAYGPAVVPFDFAAGLIFGWQRAVTGGWATPALTHAAANVMPMGLL